MAAEIINSILDGPKGIYLVVDASDMKVAFREFLQMIRESEDEKRAYDEELATVTREEACKIFNRSYSTLLRWEKDGYLVPVKIGKTPLYKMSDINMGGKTKRAMLSERSEVGSRDVSVSYGAMS
jgi:hypothetical protein